jgi:hypothetical protein
LGNNAPTRFRDPLGLDYIDINVAITPVPRIPVVVTGGVMFNECGYNDYLGGGLSIGPPISGAITHSYSDPSPGWNIAFQYQIGYAAQVGLGPDGAGYQERGVGWPIGASLSVFYVWPTRNGPLQGPRSSAPCLGSRKDPPFNPEFIMP